jgi:hypothetical protein
MTTHQATPPATVVTYFRTHGCPNAATSYADSILIDQTFTPEKGWRNYPGIKRSSGAEIRRLRRSGVTRIAFRYGSRVADFSLKEVAS